MVKENIISCNAYYLLDLLTKNIHDVALKHQVLSNFLQN